MSLVRNNDSWSSREVELAADYVTVGLDPREQRELESIADREDLAAFETVAAAIHLGALRDLEAPPRHLLDRLHDHARLEFRAPRPEPAVGRTQRAWSNPALAWAVAAALLVMTALQAGWLDGEPDAARRRDLLVSSANDLVRATWSSGPDPAGGAVTGDVVWSPGLQEGYMRFEGLVANDARTERYQLWIFDSTRRDWADLPVDGGLFDVTDAGEVVVPIDPKLAVKDAAMFAVTVEDPAGAVVSERGRLLVTATP